MNPENYWVVSLTVISYKILGGIIKQVTCQLLEIGIAITRNHAKLTSFVFLIMHFQDFQAKESNRCNNFDFLGRYLQSF